VNGAVNMAVRGAVSKGSPTVNKASSSDCELRDRCYSFTSLGMQCTQAACARTGGLVLAIVVVEQPTLALVAGVVVLEFEEYSPC
jgi:hypothetical protein